MQYSLEVVYPWLLLFFVVITIVITFIRYSFVRAPRYIYPLTGKLKAVSALSSSMHRVVFNCLRIATLLLLSFGIGQPHIVDTRTSVNMPGIDIVLSLDVSGSMQFQDDQNDQRSRLQIAKDEAIRFVHMRVYDAIGLVIFGKDVLSRAPLTLDKKLLVELINETEIGIIDPDGTVLARSILTAINRLKSSQASSKIIILLTDGEPSAGDAPPAAALEVAKKLGIKIYTIGIGSDEDSFFLHPLYGLLPKPKINKHLLQTLAQETGGMFFLAANSHEVRKIYDTIDTLEKTVHEVPYYYTYYELLLPLIMIIFALIMMELGLRVFWWYGI